MSRIGCQDVESSSLEVTALVPPVESEIPGPQFDLDCPEFEIPCVCTPITTDATITLLGPFAEPYADLNADCTVVDGCDSYHISLDLGIPTATIPSLSLACGLDTNEDGALIVDFTDVVGNGLEWDAETCQLLLDTGCGIFLGEGIEIDFDVLAGNAADTGLVVQDNGEECSALSIDPVATVNYEYPADEIVGFAMVGGQLVLNYKRRTINASKNAAGNPIAYFVSAPEESSLEIDPCLFDTCCSSQLPLTSLPDADETDGSVPFEVNFQGDASGGSPPYSYFWDFGDGNTSTSQNPTHEYDEIGEYEATLTITDQCGNEASDFIVISVDEDTPTGETCETAIPLSPGIEGPFPLAPTQEMWFVISGLPTTAIYVEIIHDPADESGSNTMYYTCPPPEGGTPDQVCTGDCCVNMTIPAGGFIYVKVWNTDPFVADDFTIEYGIGTC